MVIFILINIKQLSCKKVSRLGKWEIMKQELKKICEQVVDFLVAQWQMNPLTNAGGDADSIPGMRRPFGEGNSNLL